MDAVSEHYLSTARRVERHMVNLNLYGCDFLRCYSCMLVRFIGTASNVLDCTLRSFMEMNHVGQNLTLAIHHPGPPGWWGAKNGSKKIFKSYDFDSMDKMVIFGRSHVLVSSSLLWMFFKALAFFGRRNLPLHTKSENAGRAEVPMDTVLLPSSRHTLAKLRRDGAGGTNEEGDLQYYRDLNKSELPSSKRGEVDSYGDDAAAGPFPFSSSNSASGSAVTQELLFCGIRGVTWPRRLAVLSKRKFARHCAFRRKTEQALSFFYLTGEVQQVAEEKRGAITRSMAKKMEKKMAWEELLLRRKKYKAEKGCVCVAE